MRVHVLKLNKGLRFSQKPVNINVSISATPKLALALASRYNCNGSLSYVNIYAKFHERGSDGDPCSQT